MPKIFHFIWIGDKPMPQFGVKLIDTWKQKHPDWEIIIWDNDKVEQFFLNHDSPYFLFNQKAYLETDIFAQKTDLLRLEILFWFGGVYIDIDFVCLKNIESLLKTTKVFGVWSRKRDDDWIDTGILGSVPHHRALWKAIMKAGINCNRSDNSSVDLVFTTGPGLITEVWKTDNDVTKFPSICFYPFSVVFGEEFQNIHKYLNSYGVHLFLQSYTDRVRWGKIESLVLDIE